MPVPPDLALRAKWSGVPLLLAGSRKVVLRTDSAKSYIGPVLQEFYTAELSIARSVLKQG